jgi:hypothetical protein
LWIGVRALFIVTIIHAKPTMPNAKMTPPTPRTTISNGPPIAGPIGMSHSSTTPTRKPITGITGGKAMTCEWSGATE